jgi:hypothetical protein
MKTLLLDTVKWDLVLDAAGNIAAATNPYALAQDVASALRLFLSELWYDFEAGVPYFSDILGHTPPVSVFQELLVKAAMTVPEVVAAQCTIQAFENRSVTGQVLCTDNKGRTFTVNLQ